MHKLVLSLVLPVFFHAGIAQPMIPVLENPVFPCIRKSLRLIRGSHS